MNRAEPSLLYQVKQLELAVRSQLDDVVRPFGLTTMQYTAMTVLERDPDMTSARLARASFVTAQSMADIVTGLTERDLIDRHRDPQDRRRLVLSLTDRGREVLAHCRGPVADLERRMIVGLDTETVTQLRTALRDCRRNLTDPSPPK
ncbi:MarR family winged helix-turn-helix transcriptional regulator [Branchiibius cervicis]|uniref:MarR family winged helix-turn-helix transcriptional regulator n=1 Tax=Branchiibius cervicis TaxID=908252 RepID=A0ABW2APF2_9MICO